MLPIVSILFEGESGANVGQLFQLGDCSQSCREERIHGKIQEREKSNRLSKLTYILKLFLLIRLSPYPFNLLNVLFAATDIKLSHFAVGTALSLLKIALHVYIGANLTSFAKHVLGEDEDMSEDELRIENIKYVAMMFFSIIAFVVMAYLYRVAKAAVAEANNLDEEQMSFLNHHDEEVGFLDDDDSEDENNNAKSTPVNLDVHTTSNTAVATDNQLHMNETRDNISLDNWDNWGDDDSDSDVAEQVIPLNQKLKKEGLGKSD